MPQTPYPASRLRLLLFPEVCLLGGIAGILAERHPGPGMVLFALVWLLDFPRIRFWPRSLVFVLSFCCAFAYTSWQTPLAEPVPGWLRTAAEPDGASKADRSRETLRIRGTVLGCDLLQGNLARVILTDVLPAKDAEAHDAYKGKIAWAWREPDFMPLPGERLEADLRIARVRGLANPGAWETDDYWRDRGVWFKAWSGGRTGAVIVKESGFLPLLRRELRERFYANLPHRDGGNEKNGAKARPVEAAAILPALVFADRSHITYGQSDLFAKATLAHSLALSGLHLGFDALAGLVLAWGIGRIHPRLWLRITRPCLAMLLSLPFALLYLWLGQMPVSLVRAACMLAFWALLLFLKRPRVLLDGLFAALAVILLINPLALFDISLQLSALSVAAIGLCIPGLSRLATRLFPLRRFSGFWGSVARGAFLLAGTSFSIQVFLLPLTVFIFGTSGLLFPLNLLWLPVLGTAVLPLSFAGLLFSALGLEGAATFTLYLATVPCEALLWLLSALENASVLAAPILPRPHWLTIGGYWLLCLVLPGFFRHLLPDGSHQGVRNAVLPQSAAGEAAGGMSGQAAFVLCAFVMGLLPVVRELYDDTRPGVRLRVLDVGQGQSVLLEWSGLGGERNAGRVLVDGGGFPGGGFDVGRAVVAPVLTDNALPRLDMVIASHPDTDHLSGLLFILRHFAVGRYYGNGARPRPTLAAREQEALRRAGLTGETLCAGDRLELAPELCLEVLWPLRGMREEAFAEPERIFGSVITPVPVKNFVKEESGNNASLVLRLVWRGVPLALLCGDVEQEALHGLMVERAGADLAAGVLVLPHHGSGTSLSPDFYRAVRPALALVSCGYGNRWGFPAAEVLEVLREQGIPLRGTAEFGQIDLRWRTAAEPPEVVYAREYGYSDATVDERSGGLFLGP